MPKPLTPEQKQQVLRYVCDNSPNGETFQLPPVQFRFGVDIGWALLVLEGQGLCGVEDPDLCWSTPKGRAAVTSGERG